MGKKGLDNINIEAYKAGVQEAKDIAIKAIQADKDILSQITLEYNEDDNLTRISFPKGVVPLTFTINTHDFYFKNRKLVNGNGEEVEGYNADDIDFVNSLFCIDILGDISEQVINSVTYILCNGNDNLYYIENTYNLFNLPDLDSKYVKIMQAPTSSTLTDEEFAQIQEGCFINGTFLNLINPVFFPATKSTGNQEYYGIVIGSKGLGADIISKYHIGTNHLIEITNPSTIELDYAGNMYYMSKKIPAYPSNTGTFVLKCVNGTLTWVAE